MFYKLVMNNSKKNRKENSLFFMSLIISIIAFYIILSLKNQDVIIFLKTMESEAVDKLLIIIPTLYIVSLFILFFLVYFAGKYQLETRNKELGMYLMLGMNRRKLLLILFAEELWNSILSALIGIPLAIFISEIISLVTAKVVGLGIIGHKFSFSLSAVLGTIIGYFIVRFLVLIILSGKFVMKDINELLSNSQYKSDRKINKLVTIIKLIIGIICITLAFNMALDGKIWGSIKSMSIAMIIGLVGMFLLFQGIAILFEVILKNKSNNINGLKIFTFRQVQESVILKPNTLCVSALLLLMASTCFAYGTPIGYLFNNKEEHVMDYTFEGEEEEIKSILDELDLDKYIDALYYMKVGTIKEVDISIENLINTVKKQSDSEYKEILLNNLQYFDRPHLIPLSSYNKILDLQGKDKIVLKNNEVAYYMDSEFSQSDTASILRLVLKDEPNIYLDNKEYKYLKTLYSDSIVTDRSITIKDGLIVPDEFFNKYVDEDNVNIYWNATLNKDFIEENGLMQAIAKVNERLNTKDITYESYLQNMARELFFSVAVSYTTTYLGVIFLIIANTVIGVEFLMHQQKTINRYKSLTYFGANYKMLCKSARKQVSYYFLLVLAVSSITTVFTVKSLFNGLLTGAMTEQITKLIPLSIIIICISFMIELGYMYIVKKSSDKNILKIMDMKREDS